MPLMKYANNEVIAWYTYLLTKPNFRYSEDIYVHTSVDRFGMYSRQAFPY